MRVTRKRPPAVPAIAAALTAALLGGCSEAPASLKNTGVSELRKKFPEQIDLAKARAECLNGFGWGVAVDDNGAIVADFERGREADYQRDDTTCLKRLGIDPDAPTPDSMIEADYPFYVKSANCLRKGGWPISATPSLQTFKDTYNTNPWFPWDEVPEADWTEAYQKCPPPEPDY